MLTLAELSRLERFQMDRRSRINFVAGLIDFCRENIEPYMTVVECGTASGVSAMTFAHFARRVVTIDISGDKLPLVDEFKNVERIIGDSVEAAKIFEDNSISVVYLDSAHDYDHVRREIETWLPKIIEGGIMAGHDFQCDPGVEVVRAVCERFDYPDKIYSDSTWMVRQKWRAN